MNNKGESMDSQDRKLFEEASADANEARDQLDGWKDKLVLAQSHMVRAQGLKATIGGELGARVKHYRKVSNALTKAIQFKSTTELEIALGQDWEQTLDELTAVDNFNNSLASWHHSERSGGGDEA